MPTADAEAAFAETAALLERGVRGRRGERHGKLWSSAKPRGWRPRRIRRMRHDARVQRQRAAVAVEAYDARAEAHGKSNLDPFVRS